MHFLDMDSTLIVFFDNLGDYEELEIIADLLITNIGVTIESKLDGPDSRIWDLLIDGQIIQLINNDPYGTFLKAKTRYSIDKLKELIPKIKKAYNFWFNISLAHSTPSLPSNELCITTISPDSISTLGLQWHVFPLSEVSCSLISLSG